MWLFGPGIPGSSTQAEFLLIIGYRCCVLQLIKNVLGIELSADLSSAFCDGVVLCHLANHIRPGSVPKVHVPSAVSVNTSQINLVDDS